MAILYICPGCKATLSVSEQFAGKPVRCQTCQIVSRVPAAAPSKPASAAPGAAPSKPRTTAVPSAPPSKPRTTSMPGTTPPQPAAAAPVRRKKPQEIVETIPVAAKQAPKRRSRMGLLLGAAVGGCLLLGLAVGGVGGWFAHRFFQSNSPTTKSRVAAVSTQTAADNPEPKPIKNTPPTTAEKAQTSAPPEQPASQPTDKQADRPQKQPSLIPERVEPLGAREPPPAPKAPKEEAEPEPQPAPKPAKREAEPEPQPAPKKPEAKPAPSRSEPSPIPEGAKKIVKTLPGTAAYAVVGGGGRYLILHLARERKLAIFDIKEARIARYIALTADNIKFTAGQDKIVLVLPDTNVIQRWDIASGERELSAPLAVKGKIKSVCMGSACQGPVLVAAQDGFRGQMLFLDLRSLKSLGVKTPERFSEYDWVNVRASADGKTFGSWRSGGSPQGLNVLALAGSEARAFYRHDSVGHVVPGPDGKVLYTGRGLWTAEAKAKDAMDRSYCLPAAQGDLYLRLELADRLGRSPPRVSVCMPGDQPLVTLTDLDLPGVTPWDGETFSADLRICFLPFDGLFVTIPTSGDRIVLHRFDLMSALENSALDYLLVTSRPPTQTSKGAAYSYQIVTRSKKGGVKYRLDSGPPGMAVSASGLVKWKAPADFADKEVDVIVNVADASGQEVFHTYKLGITAASGGE